MIEYGIALTLIALLAWWDWTQFRRIGRGE